MSEGKKITRSRAKCTACGVIVESKHRHDWVQCPCRNMFLDGGLDYVRYGFDHSEVELLTEYAEAAP